MEPDGDGRVEKQMTLHAQAAGQQEERARQIRHPEDCWLFFKVPPCRQNHQKPIGRQGFRAGTALPDRHQTYGNQLPSGRVRRHLVDTPSPSLAGLLTSVLPSLCLARGRQTASLTKPSLVHRVSCLRTSPTVCSTVSFTCRGLRRAQVDLEVDARRAEFLLA